MTQTGSDQTTVLAGLHRRWWGLAFVSAALLVLGAAALARVWPPRAVMGWAGLAALVLVIQLALLRRHLRDNHRAGETDLLAGLGPGNLVTLARGLPAAAFAGLLAAPLPLADSLAWTPALLYAAAVLPDFLDGTLARVTRRVTVLGGILDMEYDSLIMLVVSLMAVRLGKVPWWYVSLGLARYLFVGGIWLRQRRGLTVHELAPRNAARLAAGFQMAFFCVALWPMLGPPGTTVAGVMFVTPILAGFCLDWLRVSGMALPTWTRAGLLESGRRAVQRWLPLLFRGFAAVIAAAFLVPALWTLSGGRGPGGWIAAVAALAAIMVGLGAAGRVGAVGLLLVTCAHMAWKGAQPYHIALLVTSIPLLYLGTGAWALWRGDDALFARRPGEPRPGSAIASG